MQRNDVLEILKKLPPQCWTTLPSNPREMIAIKRGMSGYIPIRDFDTPEEAEARVRDMNARDGVTWAQREAMEVGSCFGWEVPGADPDRIEADAAYGNGSMDRYPEPPRRPRDQMTPEQRLENLDVAARELRYDCAEDAMKALAELETT